MSTSYEYDLSYHPPAGNGSSSGRLAPLLIKREKVHPVARWAALINESGGQITQLTGTPNI